MVLFRPDRRPENMKDFLATVPSTAYLATGSRLAHALPPSLTLHCALAAMVLLLTAPVAQAASFGTGDGRPTINDQIYGLPGSSCSGTYTAPVSLMLPGASVVGFAETLTYTLTDGACTPDAGEIACGLPPGLTLTGGDTLSGTLAANLKTASAAHYSLIWTVSGDGSDSLTFEIAIVDERPVLEEFYTHTNGAAWTTSTNWAADIPATTCLEDLHGITLQGNGTGSGVGRVSNIELSGNNLTGEIPASLGNPGHGHGHDPYGHEDHEDEEGHEDEVHLERLKVFNLSGNHLTGSIPEGLNYLRSLSTIDLSGNDLTGEIPADITDLHFLLTLDLSHNRLTGPAPDPVFHEGFPHPGHTEHVNLSHNLLSGPIPKNIGGLMPDLISLNLSHNKLTGPIPNDLKSLYRLGTLDLSNNRLTGEIPSGLGSLAQLFFLHLDNNRLRGEIPGDLSTMSRLSLLTLSHNHLSGPIPTALPPALTFLDLSNNRLQGEIPVGLSNLTSLATLILSHNQLSGMIPTATDLPPVTLLDLSNNRLQGEVPDLSTTNLETLILSHNRLSGTLPTSLPNFLLTSLHLDNNRFSGEIPDSMAFMPNLISLRLSHNQLSGEIPDLSTMANLTELWLHNNALTGTFPDLPLSLTELWLQNNQLTGEIPILPFSLTTLYLHNNRLEGEILSLSLLEYLEELSLYDNPRGARSALYGYTFPADTSYWSNLSLVVPNTAYTMCLPSTMGGSDCIIPTKVDQLRLRQILGEQFFAVLFKRPDPAPSGYEMQYRPSSGGEWSSSVRFNESDTTSWDPGLAWLVLPRLPAGRSYDVRVRTTDTPLTPWLQSSITTPSESEDGGGGRADDSGVGSGAGGGSAGGGSAGGGSAGGGSAGGGSAGGVGGAGGSGGGGGGGGGDTDDDDDDSGSVFGVGGTGEGQTECTPEAGTLVWRWIRSGNNEAILQLEAGTRGKDDEQEVDPVITLFTPDEIQENPGVVVDRWSQSSGWNQQVEREGRRNWRKEIDEQEFFVNHFRVTPEWADSGLGRAKRNIRVDDWEFTLQRPVAHSVLTGCGIRFVNRQDCTPESGTLVWRWIRSGDGEAILQIEASTRGKDREQEINPVITLFSSEEIPDDHEPVIGNRFRQLKVKRVGQRNWRTEIDEQEFFVNHFETSARFPGYDLASLGRYIDVDDKQFELQRLVSQSIKTGCR